MPRTWGYWTRHKLAILESYLDAFTTAAKNKAPKPIYIDLLAGEGIGEDRIDSSQFEGSGRIAAKIDNAPFHRLYLVELSEANAARLHQIEHDFPERDIRVRVGDCNDLIPEICAELRRDGLGYSPTFAFIDPDGLEVRWDTIEGLAHHRLGKFKTELWALFPSAGLIRTLAHDPKRLSPQDTDRADRLFGSRRWERIYEARVADLIDGGTARELYVNLARWMYEEGLNYRWTLAWELKNLSGSPLYHMIFATDNEAGHKIMQYLYNTALADSEDMRQEARNQRSGQQAFAFESLRDDAIQYRYEPPIGPDQALAAALDGRS